MEYPGYPGLSVGDASSIPNLLTKQPSVNSVQEELGSMILSASGWRKIFAASGEEEDSTELVTTSNIMLCGIVAWSFADFLKNEIGTPEHSGRIYVGCDSRPTGTLLSDAMLRVLSYRGWQVSYHFIVAAPEIMAASATHSDAAAFVYVSASHNPVGHNGFKFGTDGGGVLEGKKSEDLKNFFLRNMELPEIHQKVYQALLSPNTDVSGIFSQVERNKGAAAKAYEQFTRQLWSDSQDESTVAREMNALRQGLATHKLGIVAELNGSARSLSIDQGFLSNLGVSMRVANNIPRKIVHRIVPEGRSLNECREILEKEHSLNPAYVLGYVPDNDGDRGNLVYIDRLGKAQILQAQQVFALVALAECAWLDYSGQLGGENPPAAIAVNGPTSMRIDEIAQVFGIASFRAEVGEANVVGLASRLRREGMTVRLMGEGSNGGNITHPAAVRDPLNTLGSVIKLLVLRGGSNGSGLFERWCRLSGKPYRRDFDLNDILDSLPVYVSTSAYEDRALMKIGTSDHAALKMEYERILPEDYKNRKDELRNVWGIYNWKVIQTEAGRELTGIGPEYRSSEARGGYKVMFLDSSQNSLAYIWMRGSGTEPVFRVLADVRGNNPDLEEYLLSWQRDLITRADRAVNAG